MVGTSGSPAKRFREPIAGARNVYQMAATLGDNVAKQALVRLR
jgi:hypothetical protein